MKDIIYVDDGDECDTSRLIKHEAESGLEDKGKQEMVRGAEQRRFGLLNDRAVVVKDNKSAVKREKQSGVRAERDNKEDDLLQIDKEHFNEGKSGRSENACELIEIDRQQFYEKARLKRKARYAQGDHGIIKRAVVHVEFELLDQVGIGDKNKVKCGMRKNGVANLVKEEEEPDVIKTHSQQSSKGKNVVVQSESKHAARARAVKEGRDRKIKKIVSDGNHKTKVKLENDVCADLVTRKRSQVQLGKENFVQEDSGDSSKKIAVKNEVDHCVETCSEREEIHNQKLLEGEGDDVATAEVEILDIDAFVEKGISCPFVSSKKFHQSMMDEEATELGPSVSDDFRDDVLRVLRKPFDKEEYRKHRNEIKVGSYLDHHPDLRRKLRKYRYKKDKCLIILRGFFYWLQNLTREGAFQPWRDKQCLAVEPPTS